MKPNKSFRKMKGLANLLEIYNRTRDSQTIMVLPEIE
jgi:hypothetical protein